MSKTAIILLNRNLPDVTDSLYDELKSCSSSVADIFVIESGSDSQNLSSHMSYYANWPEAINNGLRYSGGMNFGLMNVRNDFPGVYDSYLLLAYDTMLLSSNPVQKLRSVLLETEKCGIVSPIGENWGESLIMKDGKPKAFWHIHNNCYLLSESLVSNLVVQNSDYRSYLFDASNFRGYGADTELIAKAYLNGFQAVIAPDVCSRELTELLRERYSVIKTDNESQNFSLYIEEGLQWMKSKYGFSSRWDMNNFALMAYRQFFAWHKSLASDYSIVN